MFEDYKSSLLDFYHVKRKSQRLTLNLDQPGREKLRKECVEVFLRKNTQKDKDFIRSIFDPRNQFDDQVRSIERFKLDKFRPLVSFMVEGRSTRDEGLVKLLAWLIDFPAYSEWRDLSEQELKLIFEEAAKKPEEEEITEPIITKPTGDVKVPDNIFTPPPIFIIGKPTGGSNGEDLTQPKQPKEPVHVPKFSPRYITISCILLLFISSSSFIAWERSSIAVRTPDKEEKCMYWNGDHFEPVDCKGQVEGATIIPLDLKALEKQRKINLPDTLTSYSLGKVWYKGFVKDHEFFTAAGPYPTDTTRVLKKLTSIILAKYISNNRYLQTRLTWLLYAAIFITLCGFGASRLKKEVKPPVEEPAAEEDDKLDFIQPQTVNC